MQHIKKPVPASRGLIFLILPLLFTAYLNAQSEETPFWRHALGGSVIGHPVAEVESVVVITDGGNVRSYSTYGRLLWDFYVQGRLSPFLSRSMEGTSYVCRTNGTLIAVNRSGRQLWQANLGSPLVYPVLIGWDGRLFIFTENRITCMTAAGYTLWYRTLEKSLAMDPFLDVTGSVVLVMTDGEVRRFDPFGSFVSYVYIDRAPEGNQRTSGLGSVPTAASSLFVEGRGPVILLLYEDRQIELVYINEGIGESLIGIMQLPSPPLFTMGRNDEAAVFLRDGRLALISPGKREILWIAGSHTTAAEPESRIIFEDHGIFLLTRSGASGFSLDGERLWSTGLTGTAALPSFGSDGILYSGGTNWILNAYRMSDPVRNRQGLLYGEAPPGSYGTGIFRPVIWSVDSAPGVQEIENRFSEISHAIRNGSVGDSEMEYALWLMQVAGIYISNPLIQNIPPVSVQHRTEAVRLLSFMGSRETIPFLTNLFHRDPHSPVKAAAAQAIGRIGVDPEGIAIRAFMNAVFPPSPMTDEVVLTAIAESAGAISRFSGPPLSETGIRILAALSTPDRHPQTRRQALIEIRSF